MWDKRKNKIRISYQILVTINKIELWEKTRQFLWANILSISLNIELKKADTKTQAKSFGLD